MKYFIQKKFTGIREDHSIVIDEEGKIFGFGLNSNGQINNKMKYVSKITNLKPFKNENITNIQSTKDITFALNEDLLLPLEKRKTLLSFKIIF